MVAKLNGGAGSGCLFVDIPLLPQLLMLLLLLLLLANVVLLLLLVAEVVQLLLLLLALLLHPTRQSLVAATSVHAAEAQGIPASAVDCCSSSHGWHAYGAAQFTVSMGQYITISVAKAGDLRGSVG
jgi:hypothetical protein